MPEPKRCRRCNKIITGPKAQYKQTRYCDDCAKVMKRLNTLDPWTPEERKEYMQQYMPDYRKKKKLKRLLSDIEEIGTIAIRVTALVGELLICMYILWHHIAQLLK